MPPDGKLTAIDNTRLTAVKEIKVDRHGNPIVPKVRVRDPNQPLTAAERGRLRDFQSGKQPKTWGEAARMRIKYQVGPDAPPGQPYGITGVPGIRGHDKFNQVKEKKGESRE